MKKLRIISAIMTILFSCTGHAFAADRTEDADPASAKNDEIHITISKKNLTLTLWGSDGNVIKTYPIACSKYYGNKVEKGDNKTPEGTFKITQILKASGLGHDFNDGKGLVRGAYGPWFLRLGVPGFHDIGIHGTHLPQSIGTRSTEGCIRMTNEDIADLKDRVSVGLSVTIEPDIL